jgi:integrin beta 3
VPPAPRPSPGTGGARPAPGRAAPAPDPTGATTDLDWLDGRLDTAESDARPDRGEATRPAPGPRGRPEPGPDGDDPDLDRPAAARAPGAPRRPGQARVRPPADPIAAAASVPAGLAVDLTEPAPAGATGSGARLRTSAETTALTTADPDLDDDLDRLPGADLDVRTDPLFSGTREIRTGRRADMRRQQGEVRRLRTATVILLVLAVLGAPLGFYALREAARDPVFGDLAALEVPGWAARDTRDEAIGSRWCIGQCRLRQRISRSERPPKETSAVYTAALRKAGWVTWPVEGCHSEDETGVESCWQRDEYVLDLWVYQPECEVQLKAPETGQSTAPQAEAVCPPTVVTIKVINRVGYQDKTGSKR